MINQGALVTRYFVLNTDMKNAEDGSRGDEILTDECAWLFSQRKKFEKPHYFLNDGDIVFIYKNKAGIIAMGKVAGDLIVDNENERSGYPLRDIKRYDDNPIAVPEDIAVALQHSFFEIKEVAYSKKIHDAIFSREIIQFIKKSIKEFHRNDSELLSVADSDNKIHEICIASRIAHYLEILLRNEKLISPMISVDIEYNKHISALKKLNEKERRPDIVVHRRSSDDQNLVVIEIKKEEQSGASIEDAISKVNQFCQKKHDGREYGYATGFVLLVRKQGIEIVHELLS